MALSHSRGKINSERSVVRRGGVTLSGGRLPVPVRERKPAWQTRRQAGMQANEQASKQASEQASERASNRPIERAPVKTSHLRGTHSCRGRHAIEFPPSAPRDVYVCIYARIYAAAQR